MWLWDSCFHAIGRAVTEPELAWEFLTAMLDSSATDGHIPIQSEPWNGGLSGDTQPPLLTLATAYVYEAVRMCIEWYLDADACVHVLFLCWCGCSEHIALPSRLLLVLRQSCYTTKRKTYRTNCAHSCSDTMANICPTVRHLTTLAITTTAHHHHHRAV